MAEVGVADRRGAWMHSHTHTSTLCPCDAYMHACGHVQQARVQAPPPHAPTLAHAGHGVVHQPRVDALPRGGGSQHAPHGCGIPAPQREEPVGHHGVCGVPVLAHALVGFGRTPPPANTRAHTPLAPHLPCSPGASTSSHATARQSARLRWARSTHQVGEERPLCSCLPPEGSLSPPSRHFAHSSTTTHPHHHHSPHRERVLHGWRTHRQPLPQAEAGACVPGAVQRGGMRQAPNPDQPFLIRVLHVGCACHLAFQFSNANTPSNHHA